MKTLGKITGILILAAAVFGLGRCSMQWFGPAASAASHAEEHTDDKGTPTLWTCPMHPEIRLPAPGPCPKCGMDLVPFDPGDDSGPRRLAITPASAALARIETAPVRRQFLTLPVRMVGKVEFDETRVRAITARVPGRLDRLYVDYTGISVAEGDHLVWLYSPDLLTAQQELIEAHKRVLETPDEASAFLRESNRRSYESARDKLLLWGLTEDQVDAIVKRGKAEDHMLIRSPMAGVVIAKKLVEGDYVQVGTPIYRIADLSHLWIRLDAYEQDLPWLRYGQDVAITAEALPGEVFQGWVSFIDPTLDERTRTINVRVNVENPDGRLKPGMFVHAVVKARIGQGSDVLAPKLAGKWISPMHPEIVKDAPGKCDVCGMDLVPAESLGYVTQADVERPLVVPASAVLVTGTRAVVYVEVKREPKPTYEGREVILGARAGDYYVVRAGLEENERVVVEGAFRVDSAMQIQAKPSMMSMRGEKYSFSGPDTATLRLALEPVYTAYFELQGALAKDDTEAARDAATRLRTAVDALSPGALSREAQARLDEEVAILRRTALAASEADGIEELRNHFRDLSRAVLALERTFHHVGDTLRYEAFCPMAFKGVGAAWLQETEEVLNPYFGSSMLHCGEVRERYPGVRERTRPAREEHRGPAPAGRGEEKVPPAEKTPPPQTKEPPEENEQPEKNEQPQPAKATEPPPAPPPTPDLTPVYTAYLDLQEALAADDLARAQAALGKLTAAVGAIDAASLGSAAKAWSELSKALDGATAATAIDALRRAFAGVSDAIIAVNAAIPQREGVLYRKHCPMALDDGADWLQRGETTANPYFGASMLRCGTTEAKLEAGGRR